MELPLVILVFAELDAEEGCGEEVKDLAAEAVVLWGEVFTEVDGERECFSLEAVEGFLDEVVEVAGDGAGNGLEAEVLESGDTRHGFMAAGFGEEGDVVADTLVAVGAAEVKDSAVAEGGEAFFGEVLAGGHDFHAWYPNGPPIRYIDDEKDASH
jgi:hypothetical protein